jgi:hypothetical protein
MLVESFFVAFCSFLRGAFVISIITKSDCHAVVWNAEKNKQQRSRGKDGKAARKDGHGARAARSGKG